jgi:predicted amidohydrolase
MITRCLENRIFAITSDRVGVEERVANQPLKFIGQSQVVDPNGEILYRASVDDEEMQIVDIDISIARNKHLNQRNDIFLDRRDDLYKL